MSNDLPNLWPEDIGGNQDIVTPTAILKQAATQLGQRTQQLVRARVKTSVEGDSLEHTFWIEVPSLEYRYQLFALRHDVDAFYPLRTGEWVNGREVEITSEDELKDYLKNVFSSEKTKKLINTLVRQVKS